MRQTSTLRERIEMQGFRGLDDEQVTALEPWLRLPPAITLVLLVTGTLMQSPAIILALVPFGVACVVSGTHPFDAVYNFALRFLVRGPRLPAHGAPRRFACAVASVWLVATGCAFAAGAILTGALLGWIMATIAAIPSTTGFCVPAWVYGVLLRQDSKGSCVTARCGRRDCPRTAISDGAVR